MIELGFSITSIILFTLGGLLLAGLMLGFSVGLFMALKKMKNELEERDKR